jgi:hypothetical protein
MHLPDVPVIDNEILKGSGDISSFHREESWDVEMDDSDETLPGAVLQGTQYASYSLSTTNRSNRARTRGNCFRTVPASHASTVPSSSPSRSPSCF